MIRITGEAQKNAHHVFSRRLMCCCVDIDKSSFNNAAAKEFRPLKFRTFFPPSRHMKAHFFHWSCFSPRLDPDHKSFSLQIESDHVRVSGPHLKVKKATNLPHIIITMKMSVIDSRHDLMTDDPEEWRNMGLLEPLAYYAQNYYDVCAV
jgi:hypothetical protein